MSNEEPPRALVAGKYRLTRLLGRGGMGSVWEGVHTTLSTRVAVKFIDAEHANSAEARSRFENEARAAAKLRSKFVVEVYDHGVGEDGRPFIVMEYLEGEPLDRRLDRVGRLPAKEAALILQQVCRALTKAHAAGIVHRDLKPENVFLVWDDDDGADVAKVVDFGIAKFTDNALGPSSATRTGSVLGTPYYMSPEQARGLRSVDQRTDVWSIGVIAYRAIVGQLPFDGEAVGDLLVKLCTAPIPVPSQVFPGVPAGFDAFIQRALAREPEQRFQSAQELGASLCAVAGISVRGAYGTGENPALGADGTGPYRAQSQSEIVTQIAPLGAVTPDMATGAPLSQTSRERPAARRLGKWVAGAAGLLGVGLAAWAMMRPPAAVGPAAAALAPAPAPTNPAPPPTVAAPSPTAAVQEAPLASAAPARATLAPVTELRAPAKPISAVQSLKPRARAAPPPARKTLNATPAKKPIDIGY